MNNLFMYEMLQLYMYVLHYNIVKIDSLINNKL